ncbi:MAG: hypothetical protein AB1442_03585 [Nitrospirota bacterium]
MMTRHCRMVARRRQKGILHLALAVTIAVCGMLLFPQMAVPVMAGSDGSKPVAVIDGTLQVSVGKTVYLDGFFSKNPGGGELDYVWTLVSSPEGSLATIEDSNDRQAQFRPDVAGTYKVKLIVNNGLVDSDPAYAVITVTKEENQ